LVKIAILHTPAFNAAVMFCTKKTTVVWLPNGEKSLRIWLLVLTQYTNVTDSRTDGQTDRHRRTYTFGSALLQAFL